MSQATEPAASLRKVRVLLVDDSAVMRSLLRMVLDPQPSIEVSGTASSGHDALAVFERLHPDLILLDIEMPGMNGLEVLSSIRRRDRRVPIIMCSTLTSRGRSHHHRSSRPRRHRLRHQTWRAERNPPGRRDPHLRAAA